MDDDGIGDEAVVALYLQIVNRRRGLALYVDDPAQAAAL
jgi:hypothetical protein